MGSVNPVIAPQMAGLIEGSRRELDTREAEARAAKAKRFVRSERQLKERIEMLHERLQETCKDFHLTSDRICAAVKTGLALEKKPPLKPVELEGVPSGTVFEMPALTGSWARCIEGLRHPYTGKLRPITFDHNVAKGRDDVVRVHLNHRLVQMCLRLLRAEVWAHSDVKKLHRVDVRALPDSTLDDIAVAVVSRLVVTGGNPNALARLSRLVAAWRLTAIPPVELSGMLGGAGAAYHQAKAEQEIELVWTGPSSKLVATRKTEQALLQVIDAAAYRLFMTSFVAYDVASVIKALARAVARGVTISMLLEASNKHGGNLSFDALAKMKAALPTARIFSWVDKTSEFAGGSVHAKIAVTDEDLCFISSANLTGHAMERNMEAGVLIKGGSIPRSLHRHLEALVTTNVIVKV
jgi:PLD-like domain